MSSESATEIVLPRNKRGNLKALLVSLPLLVGCWGLWPVAGIAGIEQAFNPIVLRGVAVVGGSFLAFFVAFQCSELRDRKPGLVINREGIFDNSGDSPRGLIPWGDVTGFRIFDLYGTPFVMIDLADAQKYINQAGTFGRSASQVATEWAGSPIGLSADSVGLKPDELLRTLTKAFQKYGRPSLGGPVE